MNHIHQESIDQPRKKKCACGSRFLDAECFSQCVFMSRSVEGDASRSSRFISRHIIFRHFNTAPSAGCQTSHDRRPGWNICSVTRAMRRKSLNVSFMVETSQIKITSPHSVIVGSGQTCPPPSQSQPESVGENRLGSPPSQLQLFVVCET